MPLNAPVPRPIPGTEGNNQNAKSQNVDIWDFA